MGRIYRSIAVRKPGHDAPAESIDLRGSVTARSTLMPEGSGPLGTSAISAQRCNGLGSGPLRPPYTSIDEASAPTISSHSGGGHRAQKVTPTDRLSGFGTGLATNSESLERVPRGHC